MKRIALALALSLLASSAWAQCSGVFPANTLCGNLTGSPAPPGPFTASGTIVGPGSSTLNGLPIWANTLGTQLKDGAGQTIAGNYTWSGTQIYSSTNTFNGTLNANATANITSGSSSSTTDLIVSDTVAAGFVRSRTTNLSTATNSSAGWVASTGVANTASYYQSVNGANPHAQINWDAGLTSGLFIEPSAGPVSVTINNGLQAGAPTGGDQGVGTVNVATGYYVNGTKLLQTNPTFQTFLSGSGTYTTPAGVTWIRVRMVGGGGGGGGAGATTQPTGGTGGNTTFGTTLLVANGGAGGTGAAGGAPSTGGSGGTASLGSANGLSFSGANGGAGVIQAGPVGVSGFGAGSCFGGGGPNGALQGATNVQPAATEPNTGVGGGGAVPSTAALNGSGAGGGAGGCIDAIITAPNATYSYAVGAAGAGGIGTGTSAATGAAGAAGGIWVEEHYNY